MNVNVKLDMLKRMVSVSLALLFPLCVMNVSLIHHLNSYVQDASQTTLLFPLTNNTVGTSLQDVRSHLKTKLGTSSNQTQHSEKEAKTVKNSTPVLNAFQAITGNPTATDKVNVQDAAST